MHYKNGREAVIGDEIISKDGNGRVLSGILVTCHGDSDTCNGQILSVPALYELPHVTLNECLHVDDALKGEPETGGTPIEEAATE